MTGGQIRRDGDFVVIRIPVAEVHGLRVALQPCSCNAPKSSAGVDIRDRLAKALARVTNDRHQTPG